MQFQPLRNLLIAVVVGTGMWCYVLGVLVPYQKVQADRVHAPRGNQSDLYPCWLGTREWLTHQRDPYSAEVTRDIQAGYWGRPLDPRNPNDPKDEARMAYPAYAVFLLAPTVWLPFGVVRVLFIILLAATTAASVLLWLRVLGLHPDGLRTATVAVLTIGSWPVVQGLILQQLTLLVAFLLAASAAALVSGRLGIAGILLAISTIKPQLAIPVALWFAIWVFGAWRQRQRVGWSFLASLSGLLAAAQWAMPGWFTRWRAMLGSYLQYNEAEPLIETLTGHVAGSLLRLLIAGAVVAVCWKHRKDAATSSRFGIVLSLVLISGLLIMPKWASYDQVLLLPAVLQIAFRWHEVWPPARALGKVCAFSMGWEWGTALFLSLLAGVLPALAQQLSVLPLVPVMTLPVAASFALAVQFWRNDTQPVPATSAAT